jgi:hypothetical protein
MAKVKEIENTAAAEIEKGKRAGSRAGERDADRVFEIFASENSQNENRLC